MDTRMLWPFRASLCSIGQRDGRARRNAFKVARPSVVRLRLTRRVLRAPMPLSSGMGVHMKKIYVRPMLVKRDKLSTVVAIPVSLIDK
jgi:hypothetical protein